MLLAGAVLTIFSSGASAADAPALGFTPEGLAAQRALEALRRPRRREEPRGSVGETRAFWGSRPRVSLRACSVRLGRPVTCARCCSK
jgi:hypothetical protein